VDFQLNTDQKALQEGVRSFCEGRLPIRELPQLEETGGFDRGLWNELADLGAFNLRLPEQKGGIGLGAADAVLLFEEFGRSLVPGPVVWSHLAAGMIDGAGSGEVVVGGLDLMGAQAGPYLVEHWAHLDCLLLLCPDGVYRVGSRPLRAEAIAVPLDPLTPVHHVEDLDQRERIAGPAEAEALRLEGTALVAAQLLGIAEAAQELALDYAKSREQFGRVIGSFQVIKHMLAEMFVRQEVARAAVYAAGATLDDPQVGDVQRAVAAAKILAGEAAMKNARDCIQIHGGMGYTWEHPAHYYLKRTWVLESLFGTIGEHSERVARIVEKRSSGEE
jgi:alkylation response protein AidB-like acyl-CoA dehydrogenase